MGEGVTLSTLYKHYVLLNVISIADDFQEDKLNNNPRLTCTIQVFKTKQQWLKSTGLPPKMKSVQWAARTAGASGSGAQAAGCEAVS